MSAKQHWIVDVVMILLVPWGAMVRKLTGRHAQFPYNDGWRSLQLSLILYCLPFAWQQYALTVPATIVDALLTDADARPFLFERHPDLLLFVLCNSWFLMHLGLAMFVDFYLASKWYRKRIADVILFTASALLWLVITALAFGYAGSKAQPTLWLVWWLSERGNYVVWCRKNLPENTPD